MVCFIVNLLWWVVVSLLIGFFVGFRVDNLDSKLSLIIISNLVSQGFEPRNPSFLCSYLSVLIHEVDMMDNQITLD